MPFIIRVSFLMHTYQGAGETGEPELYPSPERFYKAVVAAAYNAFGFESKSHGDGRTMDDATIRDVLAWLEGNPPDAIRLPKERHRVARAVVYRKRGNWDKKSGESAIKEARACSSVAYDSSEKGDLIWQWKQAPDKRVADALRDLCWEIPYLGEACTPVRITTDTSDTYPEPDSLVREEHVPLWMLPSVTQFHFPLPGHLKDLQQGHVLAYPKRVSKPSGNETEKIVLSNAMYPTIGSAGYIKAKAPTRQRFVMPWNRCFFIPVTSPQQWVPRERQLVAWSVAMHRLLVHQWGYGASPMLTGRYDFVQDSKQRPANNVAIHVLTSDFKDMVNEKLRDLLPGLLVMVPHDMPMDEIERLADVCNSVEGKKLFFSRNGDTLRLGRMRELDAGAVWAEVPNGNVRFWIPYPLCIRETYPIKRIDRRERSWGVKESVALAVGHVLRDQCTDDETANTSESTAAVGRRLSYWSIANHVLAEDFPVKILNAHTEFRTSMSDYVHKTKPGALSAGLSALLYFDKSCGMDCAVMAIGQSRHLGGGLLIPVDTSWQSAQRFLKMIQERR